MDVDPAVCLLFLSMQQGKMFFFIGVIMALIQGGYARRIKPGRHIGAVRMVGCLPKQSDSGLFFTMLRNT